MPERDEVFAIELINMPLELRLLKCDDYIVRHNQVYKVTGANFLDNEQIEIKLMMFYENEEKPEESIIFYDCLIGKKSDLAVLVSLFITQQR